MGNEGQSNGYTSDLSSSIDGLPEDALVANVNTVKVPDGHNGVRQLREVAQMADNIHGGGNIVVVRGPVNRTERTAFFLRPPTNHDTGDVRPRVPALGRRGQSHNRRE